MSSEQYMTCAKNSDLSLCKWYTLKHIPDKLFICEYCANINFTPQEQQYDMDIMNDGSVYPCDIGDSDVLRQHGYTNRWFKFGGTQLCIKYLSANDSEWQFSSIIPELDHVNVQLPCNSYWELLIRTNPVSEYDSTLPQYMKCKMTNKNGVPVELSSGYIPLSAVTLYKINSYKKTLYPKFYYSAFPSLDYNTFTIDVDLYKKRHPNKYNLISQESVIFKLVSI